MDPQATCDTNDSTEAQIYRWPSMTLTVNGEEPRPPKTHLVTSSEARLRISTLSKRIFIAKDKITQILDGRESRLRQRWAKKSKEQRCKLLRAAWPEIPGNHSPDVQDVLESIYPSGRKAIRLSKTDDIYKWPYLNLEDLARPKVLPLMLHSRGRNDPDVFAHADLASCAVGTQNYKTETAWLPRHMMMFEGRKTPETYGELTSWKESHQSTFILWLTGVHFDVGRGLLILDLQSKIYEFLLECCHRIFSDVPRDDLLHVSILPQQESTCVETNNTSYLSLCTVIAEAPFRVPNNLDTNGLLQLIYAQRTATEDHAWSIREDPGYFRELLLSRAKHRPENLRDLSGNRDPGLNSDNFWNEVISTEIDETYRRLTMWHVLHERAKALHSKAPRGFVDFDHQRSLPKDVEDVVLEMLLLANTVAVSYRAELCIAIPASQEIGVEFIRLPDPIGKGRFTVRTRNPETASDPLMWFFEHLFGEGCGTVKQIGLQKMVDEIQRIIEDDPKQSQRLSPFVSNTFSELALIANVCRELNSLFPWASSFDCKLKTRNVPDFEDFSIIRGTLSKDSAYPSGAAEIRLKFPIEDSLSYPIHRAYNEHNVAILRRSEWNLDIFWRRWDCFFAKNTGETLNEFLRRFSTDTRVINRTLPFRPREGPRTTPPSPVHQLVTSTANLAVEPKKSERFAAESPRVKVKTRGKAQAASSDVADPPGNVVDAPEGNIHDNAAEQAVAGKPDGKFKLKERALTVFRSLFYTRDTACQRREVNWKDFLHAMTKVGFRAEKLYGSVWHFIPEGFDAARSLQVHEPHPGNEIPHFMARSLGRRLTHTYGWTGEDFGEI